MTIQRPLVITSGVPTEHVDTDVVEVGGLNLLAELAITGYTADSLVLGANGDVDPLGKTYVKLSKAGAAGAIYVSGFVAPAQEGTLLLVENSSSNAQEITLSYDSSGTPANNIVTADGADVVISTNEYAMFIYRDSRWRFMFTTDSVRDPQLISLASLSFGGNAYNVVRVDSGATGFELVPQDVVLTSQSTSGSLAVAQHDFVLAATSVQCLYVTAAIDITGLDGASSPAPQMQLLFNVGSNTATLKHENAGSVAANRLALDTTDIALAPGHGAVMVYDTTSTRWRCAGVYRAGGAGTVTSVNLTAPAAGITVSGGPVTTSGSITLALANDLAALEAMAGTGIVRRTGAETYSQGTAVAASEMAANLIIASIGASFDGAGAALTVGSKCYVTVPYACTLTGVRMLADVSGSAVVDVWKDTYANYPATVADTITASAKPTITAATKSEDTTLTGWTTSVAAGDTLVFNVDSCTTITKLHVQLKGSRT